jgi:hypothetical protein
MCRARHTTSEWRQPSCSCSPTKKVIDCRKAQPKSANDDEYRRYTLRCEVVLPASCYGVRTAESAVFAGNCSAAEL